MSILEILRHLGPAIVRYYRADPDTLVLHAAVVLVPIAYYFAG